MGSMIHLSLKRVPVLYWNVIRLLKVAHLNQPRAASGLPGPRCGGLAFLPHETLHWNDGRGAAMENC